MHTVFVDANVLGSKTLTDWVFMLRHFGEGIYVIVTSKDVLDEAHRAWRKRFPDKGGDVREEREALFAKNFDLVFSDWVGGEAPGKDKHDAHVHHAAVHAQSDILLTSNTSDFGDPDNLPYDLYTPDEFLCLLFRNHPNTVLEVTREVSSDWNARQAAHPSVSFNTLAQALLKADCPEFAAVIYRIMQVLSGVADEDICEMPADLLEPVGV